MARKRMISPEIWESSSFSKLTDFAKLIFIGLISNADDEGKGKANPGYIRSRLFPNDEDRRVTDIKKALDDIALTMSITFYEVNGDRFYHLTNWLIWQKIDRPTPSKLPDPPQEQIMGERGSCTQNQNFDESLTNTQRELDEDSPLIEQNRIENGIEVEQNGIEKKGIENLKNNNIPTALRARAREVKLVTSLYECPRGLSDKVHAEALWKCVLDILQVQIHSLGFEVWIKPLVALGFYKDTLFLQCPSKESAAEVESRYLPIMLKYIGGEI